MNTRYRPPITSRIFLSEPYLHTDRAIDPPRPAPVRRKKSWIQDLFINSQISVKRIRNDVLRTAHAAEQLRAAFQYQAEKMHRSMERLVKTVQKQHEHALRFAAVAHKQALDNIRLAEGIKRAVNESLRLGPPRFKIGAPRLWP